MLSYVQASAITLIEHSIGEALSRTAARFPDRDALIVRHQQVRLTWSELDRQVDALARGLRGLGLATGDRVGVWAANCAEWLLLQFACARAQVVLVNINPAYRSYELRYVLNVSRLRALFLWEEDERANYRRILEEAREGQTLPLAHVVHLGGSAWAALLHGEGDVPATPAAPDDVVNMQYTSGTTGSPKGVL